MKEQLQIQNKRTITESLEDVFQFFWDTFLGFISLGIKFIVVVLVVFPLWKLAFPETFLSMIVPLTIKLAELLLIIFRIFVMCFVFVCIFYVIACVLKKINKHYKLERRKRK